MVVVVVVCRLGGRSAAISVKRARRKWSMKNEAAVALGKRSAKKRHQKKTKKAISQMYRDLAMKRHSVAVGGDN